MFLLIARASHLSCSPNWSSSISVNCINKSTWFPKGNKSDQLNNLDSYLSSRRLTGGSFTGFNLESNRLVLVYPRLSLPYDTAGSQVYHLLFCDIILVTGWNFFNSVLMEIKNNANKIKNGLTSPSGRPDGNVSNDQEKDSN